MKKLREIISEGFIDTCYVFWKEMQHVFKDQGILIFFILVPLGYDRDRKSVV